jgi:hypothetical protein
MDFQRKSARFLENHDEPRAAATFAPATHQAAAILTFLSPGLRFIHQGQMEGWKKKIPVHLGRGPSESIDPELHEFYDRLLRCLRNPAIQGQWQLLECAAAWDGNGTWDSFICFSWRSPDAHPLVVVVNYGSTQGQCRLRIPFEDLGGKSIFLRDLMGPHIYDRQWEEILSHGLYLDLPAWGYHVFEVSGDS